MPGSRSTPASTAVRDLRRPQPCGIGGPRRDQPAQVPRPDRPRGRPDDLHDRPVTANRWGRVADGEAEVIKAVREHDPRRRGPDQDHGHRGVMTPGVDPEDAHYTEGELRAGVSEAKRFRRKSASHAQGPAGDP